MKLSDLTPAQDLRDKLNADPNVTTQAFTSLDVPSSGLPDEYISIIQNGAVRRYLSSSDLFEANLLVSINVRLLTTGAANEAMQSKILKQVEEAIAIPGYVTQTSVVYEGKNLVANYSTKMINVTTRITNN